MNLPGCFGKQSLKGSSPKSAGRYPADSFVIVTGEVFLLINFANEVINKLGEPSPSLTLLQTSLVKACPQQSEANPRLLFFTYAKCMAFLNSDSNFRMKP